MRRPTSRSADDSVEPGACAAARGQHETPEPPCHVAPAGVEAGDELLAREAPLREAHRVLDEIACFLRDRLLRQLSAHGGHARFDSCRLEGRRVAERHRQACLPGCLGRREHVEAAVAGPAHRQGDSPPIAQFAGDRPLQHRPELQARVGQALSPSRAANLQAADRGGLEIGLHSQAEAAQPIRQDLAVAGLGVDQHDVVGENRDAAVDVDLALRRQQQRLRRAADARATRCPGSPAPESSRARPGPARRPPRGRTPARTPRS